MLGKTSSPYTNKNSSTTYIASNPNFIQPKLQFKELSALIRLKPICNAGFVNPTFFAGLIANRTALTAQAAYEGFQPYKHVNGNNCFENKINNLASEKNKKVERLFKRKKANTNRRLIKAFAFDLTSVLTSNAKVQIYHCLFPDCPKFYDTFQKWKYHYDSHLNIREFVCEFCKRGFNLKSNYKAHLCLHFNKIPKSQKSFCFKIEKIKKENENFIEGNNNNNNNNDTNDNSDDFTVSVKKKIN